MNIFNKKEKKEEKCITIRRHKIDENGMEYEVEENLEIPNIEEDANKFLLIDLIKTNTKNDLFWEECLIKFFNKVNKTEGEKLKFLKKIISNQESFNEFTKEILKTEDEDKLFEKYNK